MATKIFIVSSETGSKTIYNHRSLLRSFYIDMHDTHNWAHAILFSYETVNYIL